MVAAFAVNVPVGELFRRGVAHLADGDVEVEILAGERVICVERDIVAFDLADSHDLRAVWAVALELHANLDLRHAVDLLTGNDDDLGGVLESVAFLGGDIDLQLVANLLADERLLEAGDDLSAAVNVPEGLAAFGGVDRDFIVVGKGVVEEDDFAG